MALSWIDCLGTCPDREATYFASFREACCSGENKAALRSLMVWLGCCFEESPVQSMEEFVDGLCDGDLEAHLASLGELADATSSEWSGHELYRVVARARRRFKAKMARSH